SNLLLSRVVPPEETDGAESDAIALQGRVHSTDVHYRFLENGPLGTIHAKVGERIPMFITELDVVFDHNTDK
ncbi:MAG: hypothetical protein K2F79_03495, partial [Muribaculaceae bacterium]|nr:hypothetical protein [Muribaculaceae bacterium]